MTEKYSISEWIDKSFTEQGYLPVAFENLAEQDMITAKKVHNEFEKQKKYSRVCVNTLNSAEIFYEKAIRVFSALIKIGKLNKEILTLEKFCKKTTQILSDELDFENCSIMLKDDKNEYLEVVAGCGRKEIDQQETEKKIFKVGEGIAGKVAETGEYIFVPDVSNEPEFVEINTDIKIGSLLSAPLVNEGKIIGVINFSYSLPETFSTETIRLLILLSDYISQMITMNSMHNKLFKWQDMLRAHKLESLGILAGGIAHDFNNILTAILGNVSLVKMWSNPSDKIYPRLDAVERASIRAINLTQQLLTFSKGGAPIKKTTSILELIRDSAEFALRGSNIKCEFDMEEDILPVEVDKGQISQVIHNLVINAEQAMPAGGKIIIKAKNIKVKKHESFQIPEGIYIMISIIDSGTGIPGEVLSKIFDPYFTTKQKGTGLGLAIAYSIIKNHGGIITVDSEYGKGSVFNIYLPASDISPINEEMSEDKLYKWKGRILVMDDEEIVRNTIGDMLVDIGYTVEFAMEGSEAIRKYKEAKLSGRPYDIVIMDLTVPGGMGGKDAVEEILKFDPSARVVVSSGYSNDPVMANYQIYGFSGVITKPYELKKLSKELYRVMNTNPEK